MAWCLPTRFSDLINLSYVNQEWFVREYPTQSFCVTDRNNIEETHPYEKVGTVNVRSKHPDFEIFLSEIFLFLVQVLIVYSLNIEVLYI